MSFKINLSKVAHQTIEGETIIIDFDTGAYYSLNETASRIWELIEKNYHQDEILNQLLEWYDSSQAIIYSSLTKFFTELEKEELIVQSDSYSDPSKIALVKNPVNKRAWQTPAYQKFTDLQDLLLLDPIHDVDEEGWPIQSNHGSNE